MRNAGFALLALISALPAAAEDMKPKFGPEAAPLTSDNAYLRAAPAPDFWMLSSFYVPQFSNSACSVASLTMALNALRGLPRGSEDSIVTQADVIGGVAEERWTEQTQEDGDGVTFAELVTYTESVFETFGQAAEIATAQPGKEPAATIETLREALKANEAASDDVILLYYNQGVVTGDWDGPHISPVGAYDAANDRVLIMDIDRDWYVPYWTKTATLFAAMQRPAPPDQGVLAGETGGWVHIRRGG